MQKELAPNVKNIIKEPNSKIETKNRDGDQNARTKKEPLVFFSAKCMFIGIIFFQCVNADNPSAVHSDPEEKK